MQDNQKYNIVPFFFYNFDCSQYFDSEHTCNACLLAQYVARKGDTVKNKIMILLFIT